MELSNRIGLDQMTMTGANPVDFIKIAAAAGARNVALWPRQTEVNPYNLPDYSLVDDAKLRRDTAKCLADHGVTLQLIDALVVREDLPVAGYRQLIEACVEVGARRFNTVSFDSSMERNKDDIAALAELAREYDCTLAIESCPLLPIAKLAQALEIVHAIAAPNLKLVIDTMHVTRTEEVGLLATIDPNLIDYVQISDGPLRVANMEAYTEEALFERGAPGEGAMPLAEIVACAPAHVVVSGEVPMRARRNAGMSDLNRSKLVVRAIADVLARADALRG